MIRPAKSALPRDRQQFRPRASVVAPWPAAAIVLPDALAHSIATAAAEQEHLIAKAGHDAAEQFARSGDGEG